MHVVLLLLMGALVWVLFGCPFSFIVFSFIWYVSDMMNDDFFPLFGIICGIWIIFLLFKNYYGFELTFLLKISGSRTARRTFEFGRTHVVRPKGKHQATIVWLHGLGDNGSRYCCCFLPLLAFFRTFSMISL